MLQQETQKGFWLTSKFLQGLLNNVCGRHSSAPFKWKQHMLSLVIFNKANDTRDSRIDPSLQFPNAVWLIPGSHNRGIEEDKVKKLFKNYFWCFQWAINNSIVLSINLKFSYSFELPKWTLWLILFISLLKAHLTRNTTWVLLKANWLLRGVKWSLCRWRDLIFRSLLLLEKGGCLQKYC